MSAPLVPSQPTIFEFSAWISAQQEIASDAMCAAKTSDELEKHASLLKRLSAARTMLTTFDLERTTGATA